MSLRNIWLAKIDNAQRLARKMSNVERVILVLRESQGRTVVGILASPIEFMDTQMVSEFDEVYMGIAPCSQCYHCEDYPLGDTTHDFKCEQISRTEYLSEIFSN